jgi:hypothetical protein
LICSRAVGLEELLIETFKNISLELDFYSPEFCILRNAIREEFRKRETQEN